MIKTNRLTILDHQILTATGYQSVGEIVSTMQAEGASQILIDRWLQGLEAGLKARA